MERIKVPSGEITNTPFLKQIAAQKKDVILSTGMSTETEIAYALDVLRKNGARTKNITVLHCTTNYPARIDELNLRALSLLRKKTGLEVGYSDHSVGEMASIIAISLGEDLKSIHSDRKSTGPDIKQAWR